MLTDEEIQEIRNRAKLNSNRQIDPLPFAREIERAVLAKAMPNETLLNSLLECVSVPDGATIYDKFNALQQHWYVTARDSLAMPITKQEPVGIIGEENCLENVMYKLPIGTKLYTEPQTAQAAAIPEGWQLVPVEPTHAMVIAGNSFLPASIDSSKIYRLMLSASQKS